MGGDSAVCAIPPGKMTGLRWGYEEGSAQAQLALEQRMDRWNDTYVAIAWAPVLAARLLNEGNNERERGGFIKIISLRTIKQRFD
jgi:hypothetical protein